jgi:integral membrane protein (TIGR01906 family)
MKLIHRIISWFVTFLIPLAIVFLSARLILTDIFLKAEYRLPGFPVDEYGFSQAERLSYARLAWDYVENDEDISFLGDQTFPDGTPLYNERELSHMQDVKNVVRPGLWIGYCTWAILVIFGIWAYFKGWWRTYLQGIQRGGWVALGIAGTITILAIVSFWQFFTILHSLFFSSGTWMFFYSDTLIRLFPLRFWQDLFIFVGIIIIGVGLLLGLGLRARKKPISD